MSRWIIRKESIFLFLDIIIVMILSGTAYKLVYTNLQFLIYLPLIWHFKTLISLLKNISGELIVIIAMIVVPLVSHFGESPIWYLQFLGQVLAIYCIAASFYYEDVIDAFMKFMTFITIESLLFYPLILFTSLPSHVPVVMSPHGAYYGFLPGFVFSVGASGRNCGVFWEPGIFASMLIISMIISLYRIRNADDIVERSVVKEKKRIFIFTIALLTTSSSAGIVLLGLFILLAILSRMDISKLSISKLIATIFFMVIFVALIADYSKILTLAGLGDNEYWSRLTSSDSVMNNLRFKYLAQNIESLKGNVVFGLGIKATNRIVVTGADTSTSLYLMMIFGILGASFTILYIVNLCKLKLNVLAKIILVIIAMIILNKEPHLNTIVSWLLLFTLIERKYDKKNCYDCFQNNN